MRKIVILADPERFDDRLLRSLNRLFPECEVQVVDAGRGGPQCIDGLSPLDARSGMVDGAD